jgi:alpha-beta hydrolase superfamily lysophospholipase
MRAWRAMLSVHRPSQAGIVQEMQLCMERCQRLHFQYAADVSAPVRVFAGDADAVMPWPHVRQWAASAAHRNVELVAVAGGTHDGLMHTHKAAALEALARDLRR